QFWRIIADCRSDFFEHSPVPNECGMYDGLMDHQVKEVAETLKRMSEEEVADFYRIFHSYMDRAYDWNLWAAAYVMNGGCSDDGFIDFRGWLISMGEEVFENAMVNPETLVELVDRKDVE